MSISEENLVWFERGSEWRLWDLHLHTPSSYDYKNKSITDEEIINSLKENNISAAVITDHFIMDISRINNLVELGKNEGILILPGIELTSELGGHSSVHLIGIFDNKNIKNTWEKLKFSLNLTLDDIENAGGIQRMFCDFKDAADKIHELGGIISVHGGKKSNSIESLSNEFEDKQAYKELLLNKYVDIIEIGNIVKDIESYNDIVFPKLNIRLPLVICSDNHNIREYYIKENCWIKSDLSFEGLKQILYEPEERVNIQSSVPDIKNEYEVIDSIIFYDGQFQNYPIKFNSNLVSIIGSRSAGKSTLLRSIINATNLNESQTKNSDWDNLLNPNVKVIWKNGTCNEFSSNDLDDENNKKVMYISQGFLNGKSGDVNKNDFSHNLIKSILIERDEYKSIFEDINNLNRNYKSDLESNLSLLFDLESKIKNQKDLINGFGDKNDILNEIRRLEKEYGNLSVKTSVSQEYYDVQSKCNSEIQELSALQERKKDELDSLFKFLEDFKEKDYTLNFNNLENVSSSVYKDIIQGLNTINLIKNKIMSEIVSNNILMLQNEISDLDIEIHIRKKELIRIEDKIQFSENNKDLLNRINNQKLRLSNLDNAYKNYNNYKKEYDELLSKILAANDQFNNKIKSLIDKFVFSDEIELFEANYCFNTLDFRNSIIELLNNNKFFQFEQTKKINLKEFNYSDNFNQDLKTIILAILDESLIPKSGFTKRDILNKLLSPFVDVKFNIFYEGDNLERMSPGKRAFVILKVLIELDESNWPILIDQPEDDLDAKSISNDLSNFLKKTKKRRQIIIVTHNPNLVIGADSEQIIVANQEGSDSKNKSFNFEYMSGSIENSYCNLEDDSYLYSKGIKEHICNILEGGEESFKKRQSKYDL